MNILKTFLSVNQTIFYFKKFLFYLKKFLIINQKYISGGMKPKIETCINAIDHGVKEATILDGRIPHSIILELFTEHGIGTQIYS